MILWLIPLILASHCFSIKPNPYAIDWSAFDGQLLPNNTIQINFYCLYQQQNCRFLFRNLPQQWIVKGNSIVVQNMGHTLVGSPRSYKFYIEIDGQQNKYIGQTVNLTISDNQLYVQTIAKQGKAPELLKKVIIKNHHPRHARNLQSLFPTFPSFSSLPSTSPSTFSSPSPVRTINLGQIPNSQSLQNTRAVTPSSSGSGFAAPNNNSPILPNIISTSNAQYNPQRDSSSPFKAQKQAAIRRQAQANISRQNTLNAIQSLKQSISKWDQDTKQMQNKVNQLRMASDQCGQQLFQYENTKAKIQNALKDKQSKLDQLPAPTNLNLNLNNNVNRQVQQQENRLSQLQQQRDRIQAQSVRNSSQLQNLQRTLATCKSNINFNNQGSRNVGNTGLTRQTINMRIIKNQQQIRGLSLAVSDGKQKIQNYNIDLNQVRSRISSLQDQLRQARNKQQNIINQRTKLQQSTINNSNRIIALDQEIKLLAVGNNSNRNGSFIISPPDTIPNTNNCNNQQQLVRVAQNDIQFGKQKFSQIARQVQQQKSLLKSLQNQISNNNNNNRPPSPSRNQSLQNDVSVLKSQLQKFSQNIEKTSQQCDRSLNAYASSAGQLNNRFNKLQDDNQALSKANKQLVDAQAELDNATFALVEVMKQEFAYFGRTGALPSLPPLPDISSNDIINTKPNTIANTSIILSSGNNVNANSNTNISTNSNTITSTSSNTSGGSNIIVSNNRTTNVSLFISSPSVAKLLEQDQQQKQRNNPPRTPNTTSQSNLVQIQNTLLNNQSQVGLPSSSPSASSSASILGDQFKIGSRLSPRPVEVNDIKAYVRRLGMDTTNAPLPQNRTAYPLDDQSRRLLTIRKDNSLVDLSSFSCVNANYSQSAVIQQIWPGSVIAKSDKNQIRLSISECTKIISTSPNGALRQGTRIYFIGVPVVSLPNNLLINAHLILCVPSISI